MPKFVATIVANGQRYSNWESVSIRRDYGNAISAFQFSAAENVQSGQGFASVKLAPGDPVQVYLDSNIVIDGSITTRSVSFDAKSHDLVIAGRSKTDGLTSSVKIQPGNYNGYTFEQAARGVLGPSGIGLVIQNPPTIASKPFKSLCAQYGETIGEFIERIAKMRGFFLTDDENGNLVASQLDPSSGAVAELQEGRNILRAVGKIDNQNAFSSLSAAGQQPGDDQNWPPRDYSATAQNQGDTSGRFLLMISEHAGDAEDHQQRINYEAAHMMWPIVECSVTVVGWYKDDGSLWIPTENVSVISPSIFPNTGGAFTLGIQAVTWSQDSQNGTTTTLDLRLPGALSSLPNPNGSDNPVGGGGIGSPQPAQADPPDTST